MKKLHNLFWTLPFICFLGGYYALSKLYTVAEMPTPSLIGKTVPHALRILSAHQLNVRILAEKDDAELPEGTILSQTPVPHASIKSNQSVFLVISKKPLRKSAPDLIGKTPEQYKPDIKEHGIRVKEYHLESAAPTGHCFAQFPQPHELLEKNDMIAYISAGNNKPILFPSFISKPIHEVAEFLTSHDMQMRIVHARPVSEQHTCDACIVLDQRPFSGSIMKLSPDKQVTVQLQVQPIR